jgi:hypothetical protein
MEGETPEPCNDDVFKNGASVAQIAQAGGMRSWHIEEFIKSVAKRTGAAVDWHYSGGIAQVLTIGDASEVAQDIEANWPAFAAPYAGAQCQVGGPARYRAGVDDLPDDVIAVC